MSTIIYLHCVSHEPRISSDEVGRNTSYLPAIRAALRERELRVASLNALVDMCDVWPQDVPHINWFLRAHPKCELEIWNEYGEQYPLEGEGLEPIVRKTEADELLENVLSLRIHGEDDLVDGATTWGEMDTKIETYLRGHK